MYSLVFWPTNRGQSRRGPTSEYAERKVREARKLAKLPAQFTLDTCRHGGLTELGDSGATEAETMAASMHKTPNAARLYVKRTETQRASAARKRRSMIENGKWEWASDGKAGMTKRERNSRGISWRSLRESNPSFQIENLTS